MTIKRTPVLPGKQPRKTKKVGKPRPSREPDARLRHGANSLDALLKQPLDGRLGIVKRRDQLESQWVDHCGGEARLTPGILSLVKRVVHKELVLSHMEKMSLADKFDLTSKQYVCLSNSLRLDLQALETMLRQRKPKPLQSLTEYIELKYGDKSE
jgi:hypothetical protein